MVQADINQGSFNNYTAAIKPPFMKSSDIKVQVFAWDCGMRPNSAKVNFASPQKNLALNTIIKCS